MRDDTDPDATDLRGAADPILEARLTRMEQALEAMLAEIGRIRAAAAGNAAAADEPHVVLQKQPRRQPASWPSPPTRPARRSARTIGADDIERFLGRYGMLGIAVFAAVAAVGTFLNWAITRGYVTLGPAARVILGLTAAAALGAWGLRLRRRERSFGSTIIALALVITLLCAYAAGPAFDLVPAVVALAGAALISIALAVFADREDDEALWCVGFGGASVAPFATSDGAGNMYALLTYGLLLLSPACYVLGRRAWPLAWRVFYAASALFTLSAAALLPTDGAHGWRFVFVLAFPFVLAVAPVARFVATERRRAAMRWLGLLGAVVALHVDGTLRQPDHLITAGALLTTAALWLFMLERQESVPQSSLLQRNRGNAALLDWIDVIVVPLIMTTAAAMALTAGGRPFVAFGVGALLALAFTWRRPMNALRDAGAIVTIGLVTAFVLTAPVSGRARLLIGVALMALAMQRLKPTVSWIAGAVVLLVGTAAAAVITLLVRQAYTFTPFITEASTTAAVVLAGFIIAARMWRPAHRAFAAALGEAAERRYSERARVLAHAAVLAPWIWAFLWVLIELSMAYSRSTSTLLLVTYFAATGVACVGTGRARHSPRLRQVGLMLALAAAIVAFYGATTYLEFAARLAAYLVTSVFLLGIAYWYRTPGAGAASGVRSAI